MALYASKSSQGFYDDAVHGSRTMAIVDPAWEQPTTTITLEPGESYVVDGQVVKNTSEEQITLSDVPDMSVEPPIIAVPNLDCRIPVDAVEISLEHHTALLAAQSAGQSIDWSGDVPVAVAPPAPTPQQLCPRQLATINARAAELLSTLSASYPEGEVQSWAQQTREAEALAVDPNAAAPLLAVIATARGVPLATLAERVRTKVQAYAVASGKIIGQRQALEDAINAVDLDAPDAAEQLEAIQWPVA